MDLSNLPDKEFKAMVIKMLTGNERIDEFWEDFNRERKY